jgi:putative MATE family efflux protein
MDRTKALGTKKISKLFWNMTIPAVTAQLVMLLYNIVDRIYIGHMKEVGAAALTGAGLFVPILMLITAFSMLIASGASPLASIALGKGNKDEAAKIMGTCTAAILCLAVLLTVILYFAAPGMLRFFGASDISYPYAISYARIYIIGTVFVMMTMGMNLFISGQGFAKVSMAATVMGAAINIILDPILIFGLNMGVAGAATATVFSQAVSMFFILHFLRGEKTNLRLQRKNLKIDIGILLSSMSLGISTFVMIVTEAVLSIVFTRSLAVYGGDMAVASMTIINSVVTIIIFPLTGFTQGTSPILSYNFGAGKTERVKSAFHILLVTSLVYVSVIWIILLFFPQIVAGIFSPDEELINYASWAMRIYFAVAITHAFQNCCQQGFVALGQAKTALFMAILRKLILLIPLILILPRIFSSNPVMMIFLAEPISDFIAASATAGTFFFRFDSILEKSGKKSDYK